MSQNHPEVNGSRNALFYTVLVLFVLIAVIAAVNWPSEQPERIEFEDIATPPAETDFDGD